MNGPDGKRDFVYSWLFTESLQCSQYFVIILRLFQKVLFQMFSWHLSLKNLDCKSTEWWAAGELTADAQWRRRLYLWSKKRNFHSKLCLEVNSSLGSSTMHISCEEGEQNMNTLKYRNMSCHMCILITTQKRWRKEVPGKEGESEEREFDVRRALKTTWSPLSIVQHGLSSTHYSNRANEFNRSSLTGSDK